MSIKIAIGLVGAFLTLGDALAAPRLAFQVYAVRDLAAKDFIGTLKAAKAIGYEGVETGRLYGMGAKDLKRACDEAGLELVALQLYPYNLTEPQLQETIAYCRECGCRRICTAWFKGSEENPNDWQLVVNVINHAAEVCAKEGIAVAYHNHDQEFRFRLQGRTACEWLFEAHPQPLDNVQTTAMLPFSPLVRQELDPAWCVLAGADPVAWLKRFPDRQMTMHVSPNVDADWPAILKTAADVGVEWFVAKPTDSPSSLDGLRKSHALLSEFSAQAFVVAERGRPAACTVVRADDAGPSVIRAADEFADYAERMTGVRLPVASRADGAAVRIVRDDSLGDDGFRLASDRTGVTVRGGVRGCLYGVYELLETYGGVGWFASWRTVVPKADRFVVPDGLDVTERPAFKMRMTSWLDAQNGDFASRLRLNGFVNRLEARHGGEACRFGRRMGSCHTFAHLLPARKYFKVHPEYFAMRGGKRTLDERLAPWGYTQPCLTNPDVLRIVTSNVLEAIRADPAAGLYGVSQNDNQQYCECPACAAVDAEEGSHAGTVVRFVNAVAAEVERHYPDAVIETLAYQYSRTPPKKTRLRRNVMPCLCSIECDFHKPLTESAYAQNRRFVEDIRGWREQTDMLYLWDYTTNFRHYLHAFPNIMALQGNLRFYRDNRVKYMFEQGDSKGLHADFAELRTWLLAKWMWNPDRPAGPLLDRFFAGYYGAAAPMARRYFDGLYALPRDSEKQHLGIYESVLSTNMPTAFFERGEALWREALAAVKDDPPCRTNVEMAALSVAYTLYQRLPRPRSVWVTRHPERFADDSRRKELAARLLTAYGPHRLRFAESTKSNDRELEEMRTALSFAAPTAGCDRVEVPAEGLTLVLPGKYGEYAADPKASHGRAIRLFNTHYEWCVRLPMRTVAYDEGATYRLRVRVRVEKDPDAKGEAFWTGVYDPEAKRDVLHVAAKVQNCGSDYVWCDLGKWSPRDCQSFWLGPGRFKKQGGKSAVRAVWVDRIELQEEKKE